MNKYFIPYLGLLIFFNNSGFLCDDQFLCAQRALITYTLDNADTLTSYWSVETIEGNFSYQLARRQAITDQKSLVINQRSDLVQLVFRVKSANGKDASVTTTLAHRKIANVTWDGHYLRLDTGGWFKTNLGNDSLIVEHTVVIETNPQQKTME